MKLRGHIARHEIARADCRTDERETCAATYCSDKKCTRYQTFEHNDVTKIGVA